MLKKADKTTEITLSNKPSILYEGHGNLYLNITNRCTMDCTFCIRNFTDGVYGYNLKLEHEPSVDEVIDALSGCRLEKYSEVVFTGFGEPLIRFDDVISIIRWLKENGCRVRVDTNGNGHLWASDNIATQDAVDRLVQAGLDAVSVSLNAQNEKLYDKLCRPLVENASNTMLEFTKLCVKAGLDVKMSVVNVGGVDISACEYIADSIGTTLIVRG